MVGTARQFNSKPSFCPLKAEWVEEWVLCVCFKMSGQKEEWKFKRKSRVSCEILSSRNAAEIFLNFVKGEIGILSLS